MQIPADEEVNGACVQASDGAVNDGDATEYTDVARQTPYRRSAARGHLPRLRSSTAPAPALLDLSGIDFSERY